MNLSNAQIAGIATALLGFVFAGAYAVASHHPAPGTLNTPAATAAVSPPAVPAAAAGDTSVPAASAVFKAPANNAADRTEPLATF